jgi:glycosyltransferase involved in cell wall biosynthesis
MPKRSLSGIDLLVVTHSEELSGGAEVALLSFTKYLYKQGLKIHIVSPYKGGFTKQLKQFAPDIPITYIYQPWWVFGKVGPPEFKFTNDDHTNNITCSLVELINKTRPALCITNTITIPWLAYASALTNTRHAWFLHEMALGSRTFLSRPALFQTIDMLSDKIFCSSQYTAHYFEEFFVNNKDIGVVYPYSEKKIPDNNSPSPFDIKSNRFILVGAVRQLKGQYDAIQAIKRLKDNGVVAQLIILGPVDEQDYYKQLIRYCKKNGIEKNVKFLGRKDNPATFVNHADIVLMCSEGESFGLVTVEGMLLGKPVIGADSAGTAEIIKDNKTGLLYKPHDINELADKMSLLINNKQLASSIGEAAKKDAERRFSEESCYQDFIKYYRTMPKVKTALNLSPLSSIIEDHQAVIDGLNHALQDRDKRLNNILNSKTWRLLRMLRKIIFFK